MTEAQARARLQRMVSSTEDPTLSTVEVDDLLALARRADQDGNLAYPPWTAAARYVVEDVVSESGRLYKVTVAGTSHATTEPTWPTTSSATVVDQGVTWQEAGLDPWAPTWDLNAAAAEGWRWKAGKAAAQFSFAAHEQRFDRAQKHQHCLLMAREFGRKVIGAMIVASR